MSVIDKLRQEFDEYARTHDSPPDVFYLTARESDEYISEVCDHFQQKKEIIYIRQPLQFKGVRIEVRGE